MQFEGETLDDCMRTMRSQHRQALRCIFRIGAKDSTTRRLRRTKSTNDVDDVHGRAKASRRFQLPAGIYDKWAECRF